MRLHGKSLIPPRRDPAFVLPGSRFAGTKFSHVIASARLSGMKKLTHQFENISLKISIHFNRAEIFLLCFYDAYDVNLWGKKVNRYLCRISLFYRSSHRMGSAKKRFLKISQYSQENTEVSLQGYRSAILSKRDSNSDVFP